MSYRDRIEELYMKQKQLFALVVLLGGCFAALADDPRPEIKLTGIVCFRGTCYALGEATSARPYAAPQRPILQPGEKFDGLEILSIDEKKGIVTFRHNNETQRLTLAQGDTPESPLGQTFNLKAADSSQLLEVYQELAGRTVLRSPVLPGAKIDLRSDGALSTQTAQEALVQAFATKSIALVPKDKKFAFAVPKSAEARLQTIPPLEDPAPAAEKPNGRFPPGLLKFNEADISQVLEIYQELAGRTLLLATSIPHIKITIRTQTECQRSEVIGALETILGLGDVSVFPHQAKFVIVQPSTLAEPPKEFVSNRDAVQTIETEVNRNGGLRLEEVTPAPAGFLRRDVAPAGFLQRYAALCGREPLPLEPDLPQRRVSLRSQAPLTGPEAIYALDVLAAINGMRFVLVGDKQVKLVRAE